MVRGQRDQTLRQAGYLRCEFDFDGDEDCLGCARTPSKGAPMYYVRTNWECEEGDYYCRRCAFDRTLGRDWDPRPYFRRQRPMHGSGWAYLHGMRDWEWAQWGRP